MIGVPDFLQPDIPDDYCLSSVFEIENVMLAIHDFSKKVDHLKGLKKYRAKTIDEEIGHYEETVGRLRQIILRTMRVVKPDQKTLHFPDIGRVSRRAVKENWEIENTKDVIAFFKKEGKEKEVIKTPKPSLDAKAAKSLIDVYAEAGVKVPGTKKTPSTESISITFDEKENVVDPKQKFQNPKKAKADVLPSLTKEESAEESTLDALVL